MATGSLPYGAADPAAPNLCRCLCLRPHNPAHAHCRWAGTQDHRSLEANGGLECPAARSSLRLYQLGTVRSKPEADLGERAYAAPDRTQIGPWRPGSTVWIGALRPLWPHDAGVLRFAIRPRSSLP